MRFNIGNIYEIDNFGRHRRSGIFNRPLGTLHIHTFKTCLARQLQECDIYICFDRYFDYSTKSSARAAKATTTRIHQLQPQTPLPNATVLKTSANKTQLNALISNEILNDDAFLKSATGSHWRENKPCAGVEGSHIPTPWSFNNAWRSRHHHCPTGHPHLQSKVRVVSDDTDVFAVLVYFYSTECLQTSTTMQSPVQGCCCIDVRETAKNMQQLHQNCSPFTHCQPMTQSQPLMVLAKQQQLKGFKLDKLGSTTVDVSELLSQATAFMAACYGEGKGCSSMTECRQRLWA